MASAGNIKVELDNDVYEIFKATRVIRCLATGCKKHMQSIDVSGGMECSLKHIYILEDGKCEQFEKKAE
jgi:hypothetical protein